MDRQPPDQHLMRILIVGFCTGRKAVEHPQGLKGGDFARGPAHVQAREAVLTDDLTPARDLYSGQQHLRLIRGIDAVAGGLETHLHVVMSAMPQPAQGTKSPIEHDRGRRAVSIHRHSTRKRHRSSTLETIAVIDFETTGLSPDYGDRATEIAAVLVRDGQIVGQYQSLMNAGVAIPAYITTLTRITTTMVRKAPSARQVMGEVADFVGDYPLVAHNASFDSKFWDAELARIDRVRRQDFICSMLVARRVLPQAPNHKLGTLVDFAKLPVTGRYHRAQADAEMTAHLALYLERELMRRFRLSAVSCQLLAKIQKTPAKRLEECVVRFGKDCT